MSADRQHRKKMKKWRNVCFRLVSWKWWKLISTSVFRHPLLLVKLFFLSLVSLGYDCLDLRRFIISLNLSHERRRASVHGFTPYCIVLHSLSFVWIVFVETYFITDPKRSVTIPNSSASKKWKAITMTMKLDIVKHCEKRKIATNTGQLLVLSHLTVA